MAALLVYLRAEAIASAEKASTAFAQMSEEQTTPTIQDVDQSLGCAFNWTIFSRVVRS